jgi:hypothetical protein
MDTTEFSEGQFVTPELVTKSPTKICVIKSEATPEKTDYGYQLVAVVDIDFKTKKWRINKDSVKNLQQNIGYDSKSWIAKKVRLNVITVSGKDRIIGMPITE